jgi:hypothetical protein
MAWWVAVLGGWFLLSVVAAFAIGAAAAVVRDRERAGRSARDEVEAEEYRSRWDVAG